MTKQARRWVRLRALGLVLTVPPLLHLVPLHRLAPRLGRKRAPSSDAPPLNDIVPWIDQLLWRLPWPWKFTCLKRAAVLYGLFQRYDMAVELWIGVRRNTAGSLEAHAWLVRGGVPFLEAAEATLHTYGVIARFPEPVPASP